MGIVIGLHGAKGSGKDQFYKATKHAFPHLDVRKIAYADPIKHEVCRIFDLASEEQYDLFKRTNVSYQLPGYLSHAVAGRQVVREIGMMMRSYNPQQFVEYVEREIKQAPSAIWCVTDVRFENEVHSIRSRLNGIIVKIVREGYTYDGHATETELPDHACDSIIYNSSISIDEYNQRIENEMRSILQTISVVKESV